MLADYLTRRPLSLALRVTLLIASTIVAVFMGLGWVIERSIEHHFAEQDSEELEVVAHSIQHVLGQNTHPASAWSTHLEAAVQGHHGIYYWVQQTHGEVLYSTPGPRLDRVAQRWPASLSLDLAHLQVWQEGQDTYRGAVLRMSTPGPRPTEYTVVIATATNFHEHFLARFRQSIWVLTATAALIAVLATWLAVHQGHAPLRSISAQVAGIGATQLHWRLAPASVPIELVGLTQSFNTMLERIEQDFRKLSNFSADIAHELRTPITNLVTQTQVLLTKERSVEAYRDAHYANLEEFERMTKMIGDMLYLAQTDNQLITPELTAVDLRQEIEGLFEYFEPWAEERGVQLTCEGHTPPVAGDRLMLRRALTNLLSNAIRYTPAQQTVRVSLRSSASSLGDHGSHPADVTIRVENPGTEIPAEHLPHLFDRFYRVDPSRQRKGDGAGLGLAIVKSIVDAHGGHVAVTSAQGVTAFDITLKMRGGQESNP